MKTESYGIQSIGIGATLFETSPQAGNSTCCLTSSRKAPISRSFVLQHARKLGYPGENFQLLWTKSEDDKVLTILDIRTKVPCIMRFLIPTGLRIRLVNGCSSTKQPPLRYSKQRDFGESMQPHRQSTGSAYSCKLKLLLEKGNFTGHRPHQATWVKMDQHSVHYLRLQFKRLWPPIAMLQSIIYNL